MKKTASINQFGNIATTAQCAGKERRHLLPTYPV